jgi:peptidoglycan hydrolase CwlO-like protein
MSEWFFEQKLIRHVEQIESDIKSIRATDAGMQSQINNIQSSITAIQADVHSITDALQNKIDQLEASILENERKMKEALGTVVEIPK